mmetsp:Transcript_25120/g.44026  ORF Transcript_25120/g.44026 Transcript_25120/m.44026 type:complete len:394 (+) Transcript_25120:49-1230(+)
MAHSRTKTFGSHLLLPPISPSPSPSPTSFTKSLGRTVSALSLPTSRLQSNRKLSPLGLTPQSRQVPKVSQSIVATGSTGHIKSYAANSHIGIIRETNEDRVVINYRVSKPEDKDCENWPLISYFGVFDGHGGSLCAEFLRDNLLDYILKQPSFPETPVEALKSGFDEAENAFLSYVVHQSGSYDRSGSCVNVVLVIKDTCYVANVGDSRAILSCERGMRLHELSHDHKPNCPSERERIEKVGGKVYANELSPFTAFVSGENQTVFRVLPGRLAISRSVGDADSKLECFGGLKGAVIAEPEVRSFRVCKKYDFILIASDGIFDKLSNSEAIRAVWTAFEYPRLTFHGTCGEGVKKVIEEALVRRTLDNVSAVLVAFKPLRDAFEELSSTCEKDR